MFADSRMATGIHRATRRDLEAFADLVWLRRRFELEPPRASYARNPRFTVFPIRREDLRKLGIGGFNTGPPMQQFPRHSRDL